VFAPPPPVLAPPLPPVFAPPLPLPPLSAPPVPLSVVVLGPVAGLFELLLHAMVARPSDSADGTTKDVPTNFNTDFFIRMELPPKRTTKTSPVFTAQTKRVCGVYDGSPGAFRYFRTIF
jgi:hypothetical protein